MKQIRKCEVAYAYTPLNEDEMELVLGETIEIISEVKRFHRFHPVSSALKKQGLDFFGQQTTADELLEKKTFSCPGKI